MEFIVFERKEARGIEASVEIRGIEESPEIVGIEEENVKEEEGSFESILLDISLLGITPILGFPGR